jgi:hypothetical protein
MAAGPQASNVTRCWSCGWAVDARDRYCRACGQGLGAAIAWYYRPIWIAVLALTVLGPFAVLLIWRTPFLGRTAKALATAALLAVTVWVAWRLTVDVQTLLQEL